MTTSATDVTIQHNFMAGLTDLNGLFQPKWFYEIDSMTIKVIFTRDNHIIAIKYSQALCGLWSPSSAFCFPSSLGSCLRWTDSPLNTLEFLQQIEIGLLKTNLIKNDRNSGFTCLIWFNSDPLPSNLDEIPATWAPSCASSLADIEEEMVLSRRVCNTRKT